jgi:tetratricopeptide (TPR) repeat protein
MNSKIRSVSVMLIVFFMSTACYGTPGSSSDVPHFSSPAGWSNKEAAKKNNQGVKHLLKAHWDVAAPLFEEAVRLSPDFAEPHFNLGVALDGMGKHEEAKQAFQKAHEFAAGDDRITKHQMVTKHLFEM